VPVEKQGEHSLKKEIVPCLFLILMGLLDLVTTLLGVHYFGAVEINPLFAGIINSNILVFIGIKLSTVILIGYVFFKGFASEKTLGINSNLGKQVLESGYCVSLMILTVVVTNNMIAVVRVL
jgi:hypothetical protein